MAWIMYFSTIFTEMFSLSAISAWYIPPAGATRRLADIWGTTRSGPLSRRTATAKCVWNCQSRAPKGARLPPADARARSPKVGMTMHINQAVAHTAVEIGSRIGVRQAGPVSFQGAHHDIVSSVLGLGPVARAPRPHADQLAIVGEPRFFGRGGTGHGANQRNAGSA